jgi:hypothetical protein
MVAMTAASTAQAFSFDMGDEVSGSLDITLGYANLFRTEDAQQSDLVPGFASGGLNYSSEARVPDSGDLVSQVLSATVEFSLDWRNYGLVTSTAYKYDTEIMNGDSIDPYDGSVRAWSKATEDYAGSNLELLDAYAYASFELGENAAPLEIRAGKQVINWGEGLFFLDGVSTQVPLNINNLVTPGSELKEAYIGNNAVYAQLGVGDESSLEAYVQADWNRAEFPPAGTFYGSDAFFRGGDEAWAGGGGNPALNFPARNPDEEARDSGQWGIAGHTILGDTEYGLYYSRYHETMPFLNAGVSAGVSAFELAQFWPEELDMIGASWSTTLGTWSFAGEVAYRPDRPLFGDIVGKGYVNMEPGVDFLTNVHRNDTFTASANGIWLGGPTLLGIDAQYALYQVGIDHISGDRSNLAIHSSITRESEGVPLDSSRTPDKTAYGAAVNWGGTWQGLYPGTDLTLDIYLQHDIKGNSHFWGNYAEGRTLGAVSLIANIGTALEASATYSFTDQSNSDYEDQDTIGLAINYKF